MNWRVLGPLFGVASATAILVGVACAPQSTDDLPGGGGGSGGSGSGSIFCGPAAQCPVDVSGADLTTPVSFATDIYPIFQATCAITACHTNPGAVAGNWLGQPTGGDTEMYAAIIDGLKKPSKTAPSMPNVTPFDWQNSFLMHKVDGCQGTLGLSCTAQDPRDCFDNPCGASMPQLDDPDEGAIFPLSDVDRNKIRAWIAQGAQNN